ncbi:MAG: hypothetical protein Q4D89_07795 [Arachnia propionica]|uniref:hypothetical protein n=1 Tax=Arachnia propionica TaxID=1750 RepID=UPI0026B00451|nr:hypothetical protein [Arachnia propionica]
MESSNPKLKRSSRKLRQLQEELARQGTPFQQLPWRDGVDLWPRYVADTRIGRILLEFDGSQWVPSLTLPGARFSARFEDWLECTRGPALGGYTATEAASTRWLAKLLHADQPPVINVTELDRIAQKRLSKSPPSRRFLLVGACCTLGALVVLLWLALATGSAVAAGAFGLVCAALVAGAAGVLRVWLRARRLGYTRRPSEADDSSSEHPRRPRTP